MKRELLVFVEKSHYLSLSESNQYRTIPDNITKLAIIFNQSAAHWSDIYNDITGYSNLSYWGQLL